MKLEKGTGAAKAVQIVAEPEISQGAGFLLSATVRIRVPD
jgi:hypothetical protein